jgi:long-chain fatty acid transport protein
VTATNPNNPLAPSEVKLRIPFNWKDKSCSALDYRTQPSKSSPGKTMTRLVLRIGYNYSNNPIPKETLSPLAPLILEHHLTGGFGFRLTEKWAFDLGAIYAFKNRATYTNPSLPFGPNAKESISAYCIYNTINYRV